MGIVPLSQFFPNHNSGVSADSKVCSQYHPSRLKSDIGQKETIMSNRSTRETVESYEPIRYGVLKLLTWTFVLPVVFYWIGCALQVLLLNPLSQNHLLPYPSILFIQSAYFLIAGIIWIFLPAVVMDRKYQPRNILSYWWEVFDRNIKGNYVYVHLDVNKIFHVSLEIPLSGGTTEERIVLRIPMGGWRFWRKSELFISQMAGLYPFGNTHNYDWEIVLKRLQYVPYERMGVMLKDRSGSQVWMSLRRALQYLKDDPNELFDDAVQDLNTFRTALEYSRNKALRLKEVVEEAITRIDGTKRFIKSKEAGQIRTWLQEQLTEITSR
jgi:hypothetical protein